MNEHFVVNSPENGPDCSLLTPRFHEWGAPRAPLREGATIDFAIVRSWCRLFDVNREMACCTKAFRSSLHLALQGQNHDFRQVTLYSSIQHTTNPA